MPGADDLPSAAASGGGGRKTFWRSVSWSSSRSDGGGGADAAPAAPHRLPPPPPLTPRSQSYKARSALLPPLQPLSIARRSLDEWPRAGSDDVGEWPNQPSTPGAGGESTLKLDLSALRSQGKKDQIAFFDKECSKVADHIYLGGDAVARDRDILRRNGITHVLNCVGFACPEYFRSDFSYKTLWLQDSPTEDITSILYDVFDYFEDVREQKGRVFVHCCQGVSRSTSLVIAYLMWREGQSFDDAFQFVKAARGIANPNMGFACQLLQCQKRVHAIPLSPNSMLRMYRMAPHSPYDPLHLVPKLLNDPSPAALDSRGAFILHVVSSIYVWIGKNCEAVMEKDAKAAAFQVVRYEKVPGTIVTVKEGHEPVDFWDAFSSVPLTSDSSSKVKEEDTDSAIKIGAGKRKVEAYDVDFEVLYKAISGGVVPPFPSSGPGNETHLPIRESHWSLLRRKFIPNTFYRVYSDSALMRDVDPRVNRIQILTADSSTSPPHLSPSSLSSDSSSSSKSSSDSPSLSPSTSSSPALTPLSVLVNVPDTLVQPSPHPLHVQSNLEPFKPCLSAVSSPIKGFSSSIAERRGSFSPLKLPTLSRTTSLLSGKAKNESAAYLASPREVLERSNITYINAVDNNSAGGIPYFKAATECADDSSAKHVNPPRCSPSENGPLLSGINGLIDDSTESPDPIHPIVYRYPEMKKLDTVSREDIDSNSAFLFVTPNKGEGGEKSRMLYLWIGSGFKTDDGLTELENGNESSKVSEVDWNRVCYDFLASMGLPKDLPVKVVKRQEPKKFLELFNSSLSSLAEGHYSLKLKPRTISEEAAREPHQWLYLFLAHLDVQRSSPVSSDSGKTFDIFEFLLYINKQFHKLFGPAKEEHLSLSMLVGIFSVVNYVYQLRNIFFLCKSMLQVSITVVEPSGGSHCGEKKRKVESL